jgi:hypothetical protein
MEYDMKTKERCLQFIENINDTAEKMMVGTQFNHIPADQVNTMLKNISRWCDYLQDSVEQETQD